MLRLVLPLIVFLSATALAETFRPDPVVPYLLNPDLPADYFKGRDVSQEWGWRRDDVAAGKPGSTVMTVPYQTGRGVIAAKPYGNGDPVLLKGTGVNSEMLGAAAKLRYDPIAGLPLPADGNFGVREALVDMHNSWWLSALGVWTAKPLGVVSREVPHEKYAFLEGVYAREFTVQTRFSNLEEMTPEQAKRAKSKGTRY